TEGVLADECGQMLTNFFRNLRERKKEEKRMRILADEDVGGAI
ncbi:tRNA-specific adenosine deaminase, partial [Butyricicoccus sp. 1XD8-22]